MIESQLAIVTGAAGTLGAAIVTTLKKQGWQVVGLDRQEDPAREIMAIDLANTKNIRTCFQTVTDTYGAPNALVNNAGVFIGKSWDEISEDEIDQTFAVNVRAPFLLSTLFARAVIAEGKKASIVNVASVAGREPGHDIAYASSKAALIQTTRGLGRQLANRGVRVNAVAPGVISGPMADRIPEPARRSYIDRTPMQRFAEPEEIAAVISFLLSPAASYMTGAILDVNGGLF